MAEQDKAVRKLAHKQWERVREIPEYIACASAPGTGKTPTTVIQELETMRMAGTPKWGLSKLSQHLATIRKANAVCDFFFPMQTQSYLLLAARAHSGTRRRINPNPCNGAGKWLRGQLTDRHPAVGARCGDRGSKAPQGLRCSNPGGKATQTAGGWQHFIDSCILHHYVSSCNCS